MVRALSRHRNASKRLRDLRFHSFEFFLRHWPAFHLFNQMIEQHLSPTPSATICQCLARQLALQL
jgi:hypothetical protein